MFFINKYHNFNLLLFVFIILIGCQLQEPKQNHGIVFLENRSKKLVLNNSNKNDVLRIIGQPHSKSINNENEWIYIERVLSKGEFHKLGRNILKTNNILVLNFDKYGILEKKTLFDKESIEKIKFSKRITENQLTKKSFVEKMLTSLKEKMYGNR